MRPCSLRFSSQPLSVAEESSAGALQAFVTASMPSRASSRRSFAGGGLEDILERVRALVVIVADN